MFEVKVYSGKDLKIGAARCISAGLYVPGWSLLNTLKVFSETRHHEGRAIALGLKNDEPVAVVLRDFNRLMAFTKEFERFQGFGTWCLKALECGPGFWASRGIQGSENFWDKNSIHIR